MKPSRTNRTASNPEPSPSPTFGADEIIAAITAAKQSDTGEGLTTEDLVLRTGRPLSAVREALRRLHLAGRLVPQRVMRPAVDGSLRHSTAYTVLPAK